MSARSSHSVAGPVSHAQAVVVAKDLGISRSLSLQMVHDLAAKRSFSLRFNCKNLAESDLVYDLTAIDSYEAIHTSIAPFPAHDGLTFANTKLSKRRNGSHAEEYGKFYIELFRVTRHDSAPLLSESTTLKVMPKFWMISARDGGGIGSNRNNNGVTFWVSDSPNDAGQLRDIKNWRRVPLHSFAKP